MKKNQVMWLVAAYYVGLLGVWFVFHLVFSSWQLSHTGNYFGGIINSLVKVLFWIVPSVYLIRRYQSELRYSLSDLFSFKIKWSPEMWLVSLAMCFPVVRNIFSNGGLSINRSFHLYDLIWIALVGLTEEILFRGWIQNAFVSKMKVWQAMVVTNLLFVVIHFPIQVHTGAFPDVGHWINIFVLGMVFSYSFETTKSLWIPILLHTLWDLFVTVF